MTTACPRSFTSMRSTLPRSKQPAYGKSAAEPKSNSKYRGANPGSSAASRSRKATSFFSRSFVSARSNEVRGMSGLHECLSSGWNARWRSNVSRSSARASPSVAGCTFAWPAAWKCS